MSSAPTSALASALEHTLSMLLTLSALLKKDSIKNLLEAIDIILDTPVLKSFFPCTFCDRGVPGCLITLKYALETLVEGAFSKQIYPGCINGYIDEYIGTANFEPVDKVINNLTSECNLRNFRKYYLDVVNQKINKIRAELSTVARLSYIESAARQILEDPEYKQHCSYYNLMKYLRRYLNGLVFWRDPQDHELKNGVFKPKKNPLPSGYSHCESKEWTLVLLGMKEVQRDPFLVYMLENWSRRNNQEFKIDAYSYHPNHWGNRNTKNVFWNPELNPEFQRLQRLQRLQRQRLVISCLDGVVPSELIDIVNGYV